MPVGVTGISDEPHLGGTPQMQNGTPVGICIVIPANAADQIAIAQSKGFFG